MKVDPPDLEARRRAIDARGRNVLIDAGAGAGKTSILVARILALVAPVLDSEPAISLSRIAAITFTRRAAGELRLRVRGGLLRELAGGGLSEVRRQRFHAALAQLDTAPIGTIHSFADQLLRLRPMQARISPSYDIVEDVEPLVEETFALLVQAVQHGSLAAELVGQDPRYVAEVEHTFQQVLHSRFLVRSFERDPLPPRVGLDLLVRGFLEHRDRTLTWEGNGDFEVEAFEAAIRSYLEKLGDVVDDGMPGTRWLLQLGARLRSLTNPGDPFASFELVEQIAARKHFKKTKHFAKKSAAQALWTEFDGELAEQLSAPLRAVMARRLARTRHAVFDLYERVKTRRAVIDSIDLLVRLRDLLQQDLATRDYYQKLFDHVLVDELQDTDPLQAEIVLFLTEATPKATRWQDVVIGSGRLTLVGDPKQSIYRFRRADVGMYDELRAQVARGDHEAISLTANFRTVPLLVEWANDRFATILGTSADRVFDVATGQVFHRPQIAARAASAAPVVQLPYESPEGILDAASARALEGEALGAYLRWLVDRSGHQVEEDGHKRPVQWGDIAVLALVTSNLRHAFAAFDAYDIPYAAAGGSLFTSDALHQQFLLGLRAIADRNDGVAEAALLRRPFFEVDLLDLVRERAFAEDEHAARAAAARAVIQQLRRDRFTRTPGATARGLLERTGIGRTAALGPNGEQRLRHLRELCLQLELLAAREGLDYDGVTARLRDWIENPPKLDPPRPIGAAAVPVLTVHQAKGLEFPIVVLWDGMGLWRPHEAPAPWRIDREGTGWSMKTNDVTWEEPPTNAMLDHEHAYAVAERKRLVYVAATRARDLLVIPRPTWTQEPERYIHAKLLEHAPSTWVHTMEPFVGGVGASWAHPPAARALASIVDDTELDTRWALVREAARAGRHVPRSVTALAKAPPIALRVEDVQLEPAAERVVRIARHGPIFGDVVHRAIGLVLRRSISSREAVDRMAEVLGLERHHDEAVADVERAIAALTSTGLLGARTVRLEYGVAGVLDGSLVSGYIDLVSAASDEFVVIDFKTDRWPSGQTDAALAFPAYATQVRTYAKLVGAQRCGLLFTSAGALHWV